MSDALSDILKDQERGTGIRKFYNLLADYLGKKEEDKKLLKDLKKVAEDIDNISGCGYFSGPTSLLEGLDKKIELLKNGDKNEWVQLLSKVVINDRSIFQKLKKLSPFSEGIFAIVDYGCGFVNFGGELKEYFDKLIEGEGLKKYDADKYAVILSKPELAEIIWLHCGIGGVNGPRKVK